MDRAVISRRSFLLAAAAAGAAGIINTPTTALADGSHQFEPSIELTVEATPCNENAEPCLTRIKEHSTTFDQLRMSGESELTVEILPPSRASSNGARRTTSSSYSDPVAKITIKATWTMSTNKKKVNLSKVIVTFTQKGGEITKRGVIAWNNDLFIKRDPAGLKCTIEPTWGYLPYYAGNEGISHQITAWGKATPSGMSGSTTDISCKLTYGCYA